MSLNIPVLYGTIRDGRKSEPAAKFIHAELLKRGVSSEYVTPEKFHPNAPLEKHPPAEWQKIMTEADALIIVSPEYNHGYPGALKELIDSLYAEYNYKPVGICGAAGLLGGGRMIEQLRQVVIELKMVPIHEALYFPMVWTLFDEEGRLKNEADYAPRVEAFFKELFWYAEVLKEGRKSHPMA